MSKHVVAALQLGSDLRGGKQATLEKILSYEDQIKESGAELVVLPEALLGSYPKGEIFETYLGYRLDEGRDKFCEYFKNAITDNGSESEALAGLSARTGRPSQQRSERSRSQDPGYTCRRGKVACSFPSR